MTFLKDTASGIAADKKIYQPFTIGLLSIANHL